jgi:DNA-binding CsgD family transcriptional regulator
METWIEATGPVIKTIGTESFSQSLSALLQQITPYDYTVIFGYHGADRPMDLFDDFPRQKRKVFVEDYQEGPYLLDPFYLACEQQVSSGLYRIRDLAPDRFFQGEYFRSYYIRTGLAEEVGYFITLPDDAIVVVSLMREKKAFSAKEIRQLRAFLPIVQASCQRHWAGLAARFGEGEQAIANTRLQQSVQRAFLNIGEGILTPRERQVVEFTLKGHSADAVGRLLEISPGTVRIHRRNVYAKLRISSQGELFSKFIDTLVTETGG